MPTVGYLQRQLLKVSKKRLFLKQGGRCASCGKQQRFNAITIDHIIPRSRGGDNSESNLQLLCKECNLAKGNRRIPAGVNAKRFRKWAKKQRRMKGWS